MYEQDNQDTTSDQDATSDVIQKIFEEDKQIPLEVILRWLSEVNLKNDKLRQIRKTITSPKCVPNASTPKTLVRHARNLKDKTVVSQVPIITVTECDNTFIQQPTRSKSQPLLEISSHKQIRLLLQQSKAKSQSQLEDLTIPSQNSQSQYKPQYKPQPQSKLKIKRSFTPDNLSLKDVDNTYQRDCYSDDDVVYNGYNGYNGYNDYSPIIHKKTSQFCCMLTTPNSNIPPMFCKYEFAEDCVSALYKKYGVNSVTGLSLSGSLLKLNKCGVQYMFSSSEHAMSVFELLARKGKSL